MRVGFCVRVSLGRFSAVYIASALVSVILLLRQECYIYGGRIVFRVGDVS